MGTSLKRDDFDGPVVLLKISERYRTGMSAEEVLDAARSWWRVAPMRHPMPHLVLAVANCKIVGVFTFDEWKQDKSGKFDFKYEFIGQVAPEEVWDRYIGRNVESFYPKGAANPVRYLDA